MKRNYQQELDGIIEQLGGEKPRLLLHSCCGPCSAPVLEYLTQFFDVTIFWYNPNIWPQEEFDHRLGEQKKLIRAMGLEKSVQVVTVPRNSETWYRATEGLEREPEGGARCTECFRLRLREAAQFAAEGGYGWFCSTLTLSRHKDPLRINTLGETFAREYGIRWLPSEFKKRGRELRSKQLCEAYGIYRQNYCGCEYSAARNPNATATAETADKDGEKKPAFTERTAGNSDQKS